jgi:protein-tyrosine phosphatase
MSTSPQEGKSIALTWAQVGNGRLALWHRPGSKSFPLLKEAGCTRVVTLLSAKEGGASMGLLAANAQLAWTWIPLANATPPTGEAKAEVLASLAQLSTYLDEGESLLMHCAAGIHRTGMLAYALLRLRGMSADDARGIIARLRGHTAEGMHPRHYAWGDEAAGD